MNRRTAAAATIVALAAFGFIAILYATTVAAGASPDSVSYLRAADHIAAGEPPGGQFPPLYPALLAAAKRLGLDPLAAARWLNAALYAANIALVGALLLQCFPGKAWPGVAGALLMLASPAAAGIHAMAWTEPLFLFLSLLSLAALARYMTRSHFAWLLAAGGLAALALLTRYLGLSLLAAGALGLLLWGQGQPARRARDAVVWTLAAGLPLAAWLLMAGAGTGREFGFHPPGNTHIWQGIYTVSGWLGAHEPAGNALRLLLLGGVALWAVAVAYRGRTRPGPQVPTPVLLKLLALFAVVYLGTLALSITFFDANTPVDDRILLPVLVAGIFGLIFLADETLRQTRISARAATGALMALAVALVLALAGRTAGLLNAGHHAGFGFSGLKWRESETLALVRGLPATGEIYSNAPEAIYLHTGREALSFPKPQLAMSQRANAAFSTELEAMAARLANAGGAAVYFRTLPQRAVPDEEMLRSALGLHLLAEADDGAIYVGREQ